MDKATLALGVLAIGVLGGLNALAAAETATPAGKGVGRYEKIKRLDVNRDGVVSAEEFARQWQERFARQDTDKDGRLGAVEMSGAAARKGQDQDQSQGQSGDQDQRQALTAAPAQTKAGGGERNERLLKRYDSNADGRVTWAEFEAGRRKWFQKLDKNGDGKVEDTEAPRYMKRQAESKKGISTLDAMLESAQARFKRMDTNGDGVVEMGEAAGGDATRREARAKRMLGRLDADKDGKLSAQEYMAPASERFQKLDVDRDGRITEVDLPVEARAMWQAK
ncbi:MAG: EF-hand domain-containing protein [Hyphomicrobium sp.]